MTTNYEIGALVASRKVQIDRGSLVRYAGASGDFNPIHYRDDIAKKVGLPGVLAHGMLTMGIAIQPLLEELGNGGRVVDYGVKFTRPVIVDPEKGAEVEIRAVVGEVNGSEVRFDLTVTFAGETVLGKAQTRVVFD
jgi:acyl dehydratase